MDINNLLIGNIMIQGFDDIMIVEKFHDVLCLLLVVILVESKIFNVGSNHLSFNIILHVNYERRDHWYIFLKQIPKLDVMCWAALVIDTICCVLTLL